MGVKNLQAETLGFQQVCAGGNVYKAPQLMATPAAACTPKCNS